MPVLGHVELHYIYVLGRFCYLYAFLKPILFIRAEFPIHHNFYIWINTFQHLTVYLPSIYSTHSTQGSEQNSFYH